MRYRFGEKNKDEEERTVQVDKENEDKFSIKSDGEGQSDVTQAIKAIQERDSCDLQTATLTYMNENPHLFPVRQSDDDLQSED